MKAAIFTFCLVFLPLLSFAELPYKNGEVINFDIRYKYGLVMVKAGSAQYRIDDARYGHRPVHKTTVNFKTSSFFDKIYKIRDTLSTYTDRKAEPMYYVRHIHEGDTKYKEETHFNVFSSDFTEVRTIRTTDAGVKFDTILVADNQGFDFLSIFTHLRTWDFSTLPMESTHNLAIFTGKKRTNIILRFKGQTILERSETLMYNTYKIELDIADIAFSESKNAMEAWVSIDKNHIPLRIKAKLKVGAIEVDLANYEGLKYPLTSEVRIPPRK
jgi:Protein of unknown function (DUF3108).